MLSDLNAFSSTLRKLKRYAEADKLLNSIPSTWNENTNILMEMALVKIGMSKDDDVTNYCLQCWPKGSSNETGIYTCPTSYWRWGCSRKAMAIHSNMYDYYRRAKVYARKGERDKAINHLRQAVDKGYTAKQHIENEKSFALLKSDARWEKLLGRLK